MAVGVLSKISKKKRLGRILEALDSVALVADVGAAVPLPLYVNLSLGLGIVLNADIASSEPPGQLRSSEAMPKGSCFELLAVEALRRADALFCNAKGPAQNCTCPGKHLLLYRWIIHVGMSHHHEWKDNVKGSALCQR